MEQNIRAITDFSGGTSDILFLRFLECDGYFNHGTSFLHKSRVYCHVHVGERGPWNVIMRGLEFLRLGELRLGVQR